jgi:hypothetical protein
MFTTGYEYDIFSGLGQPSSEVSSYGTGTKNSYFHKYLQKIIDC